jgi:hypothetical protein
LRDGRFLPCAQSARTGMRSKGSSGFGIELVPFCKGVNTVVLAFECKSSIIVP